MMETTTITIPLDTATAERYAAASPDDQRKIRLLFRLLVQGYTATSSVDDLLQIMDEIGANAQQRGLTPEILEAILNEDA